MGIRGKTFLRHFDPMIQETVTNEYERLGVNLHKESQATKVEKDANGKLTVTYKDAEGNGSSVSDVDQLIWAVGRTPMTKDIGLEEAGVKLTETGHVHVDEYQNSSVENIYALGDVSGEVELTPVACLDLQTFPPESSTTTTFPPLYSHTLRLVVLASRNLRPSRSTARTTSRSTRRASQPCTMP